MSVACICPSVAVAGHVFTGAEEPIGDRVAHQQYDLPVVRPLVEHSRVRLGCPGCGRPVLAELPGAAPAGFGPRLDAHIAMLAVGRWKALHRPHRAIQSRNGE